MTTREAIAVSFTILVVVTVFVCLEASAPDATPASRSLPVTGKAPSAIVDVAARVRAPAIERDRAAPEPVVVERQAHQPAPPQTEVPLVTLHGSVTVIDPEGIAHQVENGTMRLETSSRDETLEAEVVVENGVWSCEVPANASLWIQALELGGRGAVCDIDLRNPVTVPADRFLHIEARWPPASTLVVRARNTGLDLDELQVVGDLPFPEGEGQHPGRFDPRHVLDVGDRSPIELPTWDSGWGEELALFVRRPGYAWGRIDVDRSLGGERILTLVPGGDLRVSFRGNALAAGSLLSIRSPDDYQPVLELPLSDDGDVEIESLAAGRYQVSVQIGQWFESPTVLGTSEVDVVAGRRSAVVVKVGEAPAVQVASLSGKLVIPDAWRPEQPYLSFSLHEQLAPGGMESHIGLHESDMTRVRDQPATYEWKLPRIQAGRWEIRLDDPPWQVIVDVPPGERTDVVIEPPPPALVRLQVFEQGTELMADLDRVCWSSHLVESSGGIVTAVTRDPETGLFEFQATLGAIDVSALTEGYDRFRETFEIHEGLNELTAVARRSIGAVVVFKDGSTIVPVSHSLDIRFERIDDGPTDSWGSGGIGPGVHLTVEPPGLYRVAIPDIDGYLPIPPLEIEFAPGPHPTIEVPLIRAR
jgi:hypothetical protein